jgi:hypothetical protein
MLRGQRAITHIAHQSSTWLAATSHNLSTGPLFIVFNIVLWSLIEVIWEYNESTIRRWRRYLDYWLHHHHSPIPPFVLSPPPPIAQVGPDGTFHLGMDYITKASRSFLLRPFIISIRQPQGQNMLTQMLEFKINEVSRLPRYYRNVYVVL